MAWLPREKYLLPGNAACAGCGVALAEKIVLKALGKKTIMTIPASCSSVIQGPFPKSAVKVPLLNIAFAAAAAAASGIRAALEKQGKEDVNVLVWAGDGGTYDIGIQALSGAAERRTNIIYVCANNQMYSNTGIQRSGATPYGAWTTTTWTGKKEPPKNMPLIMAAHGIPYVATACVAYPKDLFDKVKKAASMPGTKYIDILCPCPVGWRFPSDMTVEVGRLAVQTGAWVLFEVENGVFKLSPPSKPLLDKSKRKPLKEYLRAQGRFRTMSDEEIEAEQRRLDEWWETIKKFEEIGRIF